MPLCIKSRGTGSHARRRLHQVTERFGALKYRKLAAANPPVLKYTPTYNQEFGDRSPFVYLVYLERHVDRQHNSKKKINLDHCLKLIVLRYTTFQTTNLSQKKFFFQHLTLMHRLKNNNCFCYCFYYWKYKQYCYYIDLRNHRSGMLVGINIQCFNFSACLWPDDADDTWLSIFQLIHFDLIKIFGNTRFWWITWCMFQSIYDITTCLRSIINTF